MRAIKRGSGIYEFLESKGLLEQSTIEDIVQAKKEYWAVVRKQWKQKHRSTYCSYTITVSKREKQTLQNNASLRNCSINTLIKQCCFQSIHHVFAVDKRVIGKTRELLMLFYEELQQAVNKQHSNACNIDLLLEQFSTLESTILLLFQYKS